MFFSQKLHKYIYIYIKKNTKETVKKGIRGIVFPRGLIELNQEAKNLGDDFGRDVL